MKKNIVFLLLLISVFRANAAYELVWSDEFDCPSLNTSVWTYETGTGDWGWGNGESQFYTSRAENVRIDDGKLVIAAMKENYGGSAYTSGRIKTAGKVQVKYGRIEARIKVPEAAAGVWPAFWMLGTGAQGWPFQGEMDIMEVMCTADQSTWKRSLNTYHWNLHGMDGEYQNVNYGLSYEYPEVLSNDYHIYGLEWTPTEVRGYFKASENAEEVTVCTMYNGDAASRDNGRYAFVGYEAFMILNVALGGSYVSYKVDENFQSGEMLVDWVRVYQDRTAYPASSLTDKSSECAAPSADDCSNMFASYSSAACTVNENNWWHAADGVASVSGSAFNVSSAAFYNNMYAMAQGGNFSLASGTSYTLSGNIVANRDIAVTLYVESKDDNRQQMFKDNVISLSAGETRAFSVGATPLSDWSNPVLVLSASDVAAGTSFSVTDVVLRPSSCGSGTGVPCNLRAEKASVFPNPASDEVFLHSSGEVQCVRLFDTSGHLCGEYSLCGDKFSVSSLQAGFYLLQVVYTTGRLEVLKVVKK